MVGSQPVLGISLCPMALTIFASSAMGATPLALSPYSFFSFSIQIRAKQSEPRPFPVGSRMGMAAAMATAASIAFPPAFITSRPIWAPRGTEVQAIARRA